MAQPTPYNRQYNFTDFQAVDPDEPLPANQVDAEFNAVETTLDGVLRNLAAIQRDDGGLANQSVHPEAISNATLTMLSSDIVPRGAWVTATAYAVNDLVTESDDAYLCIVTHTSGTFATDLAANKWILLTQTGLARDGSITPTANIPMGGFKFTSLGNGSARTDSINLGQVQDMSVQWAAVSGTANAIVLTLTPPVTTYVAGQTVKFKATADNTGAVTVDWGGGAIDVLYGNEPLVGGEIVDGSTCELTYDGTAAQLSNRAALAPAELSVMDFGAVGDGVTDDAAAFTAADASGAQIRVPAGVYKLGSAIAVTGSAWDISPLATFTGAGSIQGVAFNYERGFYTDQGNGANIWRVRDRLMIGDAVEADGKFAGDGDRGTWMGNDAVASGWAVRDSLVLAMSPNGKMAITGASRSSDNTDGFEVPIGVSGFLINDDSVSGWALYADVQHESSGWSAGLEVAAKNKSGADNTATPYDLSGSGGVFGLWLAGGGAAATGGLPTDPSNTAIAILKNAHTWNKGIVFGADALTGSDGTTGAATAIEMGRGQIVRWRTPSDTVGASIRSDVTTTSNDLTLLFTDKALTLFGPGGTTSGFKFNITASAVNRLEVTSQVTGVAPSLSATGSDTNVSINFVPKGSGRIQYDGTQILGPRITNYSAMTGTANRATVLDTATVTLSQLAQRIKALQEDLTTHGLIGA
jgi:hypothetical protein